MVDKKARYGSKPTAEEPEKKDKPAVTPAPTSVDAEKLKKAEDRAKEAEAKAKSAEDKLKAAEESVKKSKADAETLIKEAKKRADAAEAKLKTAEEKLSNVESEAKKVKAEVDAKLEEAKKRAALAEARAKEAEEKLALVCQVGSIGEARVIGAKLTQPEAERFYSLIDEAIKATNAAESILRAAEDRNAARSRILSLF